MPTDMRESLDEWLLDKQENGDDGSGYCDMCAGCANCTGEGESNEV
jgi:hypothetical protein